MIVCDMCPDRTPATMRWTIESIDPELPKLPDDDPGGLMGIAEAFGLLPKANLRVTVAACDEHTLLLGTDAEIGKQMFRDAVLANRKNEPREEG
jgi:hypothetical protein